MNSPRPRHSARRTARAGISMVASAALLAGCSSSKASGGGDAPGVTGDTITLGVLTDVTGPFKAIDEQQNLGVKLYWDAKNAAGKTCERTVSLETRDHGYDPQKAVTLASELQEKVLAYQIVVGSPPTMAIRPELEDQKIMAVAMSWSPKLGESPSLVIPGTYYSIEMADALDYLVDQGTVKQGDAVGHIYFQGDYGEPGLDGVRQAAEANDVTVVPAQIDPTVTDLSSQVAALKAKNVKAIFLNASSSQLASLASVSQARGLEVPIVSSAPAFAPQLLETNAAKVIQDRVLVVSSVTPFGADDKVTKKVQALYKASGSSVPPSLWVVLGYAAGSIMDQAITAACKDGKVDRQALWDAFHGSQLKVNTEGATVPLDYSVSGASPSRSINVLRPDNNVDGGLVVVKPAYLGESAKRYEAK